MSELNTEQLLAVEHQGGVLLKAGAGSGKTTVLIAHIIYLTKTWMSESSSNPLGFEEFIRNRFSKVVMMTFTKKAAGEMNVRLNAKFEELANKEGPLQEKWKICLSALPLLTVTTIDGFSRKLISAGFFPEIGIEVNIIFEAERIEQVRSLFDQWFEKQEPSIQGEMREIIDREKDQLLQAFKGIFGDSSLRKYWKDYDITDSSPNNLNSILSQSFSLNQLELCLKSISGLDLPAESECSSFEKNVKSIHNTGLPAVDSVDKLKIYHGIFASISRLAKESAKKSTPQHLAAYEGLVELRSWVKLWYPVISDYEAHYQDKILPWLKICISLFNYIESQIDSNLGMTFSDVEYFVANALENKEIQNRIQKHYDYFIVDEFQDTSDIQFKIINQLIGNNFNKLFCVGDPKQAIYGFRGGEISVFQNCSRQVSRVLTLANNYRSEPKIITFNNSLFKSVLPVGREFTGVDSFPVDAEDQVVPKDLNFAGQGLVEIIESELLYNDENEQKISNYEIEKIESDLIVKSISKSRAESPEEVCTVLYRWLKPSIGLIKSLMDLQIGFTAQYKVQLQDDPVLGLFLVLLKRKFDQNVHTKNRYPLLMLQSYFAILNISSTLKQEDLERFDLEADYWGLVDAFKKFIFRLGLTNENSDLNIEEIETFYLLYKKDPEVLLGQLQFQSEKLSLEFRYGQNPGMVQIMTAHASKGLEFDRVYLAGLYTNGTEVPDRDLFGDAPDSFKWFLDLSTKQMQKSPRLIFENELKKLKSFSESKRLFYVACTRAKKKLTWVKIKSGAELMSRPQKNSWIRGLEYWEQIQTKEKLEQLFYRSTFEDISLEDIKKESQTEILPLYFYDSVGVFSKQMDIPTELSIISELSVTRLNSLIDCPRKFYFENILKLKTDSEVKMQPLRSTDESEFNIVSSSERGSAIHAYISKGMTENFIAHRDIFSTEMRKPVEWALQKVGALSGSHELISEKPIKFKFFNFMMSGIPDLIAQPLAKEGVTQIWDFKTGKISEENLNHYWIQLKAYAYALYELGHSAKIKTISLKLCFVDQQKILELVIGPDEITQELFELWEKHNSPWKIKTDHCSQCSFGIICHR